MEKLKQALRALPGSTDELVENVCNELDRYTADIKAGYDADYADKIRKVKQVCVEEVNKEKSAIARKVAIFLESQAKSVEQALKKQRAIEDTEATSLLKRTKSLLEGVSYDDSGVSRDLQAAQTRMQRLERQMKAVSEERNTLLNKANRAHTIAEDLAKKNKKLQSELVSFKQQISEAKDAKKPPFLADDDAEEDESDSKDKSKKKVEESRKRTPKRPKQKRQRLDENRRVQSKRKSTSRTLTESQTRPARGRSASAKDEISRIAEQMPED